MIADVKDLVRYHNFNITDLLEMVPWEFQLVRMMIVRDIQEQAESQNK